MGRADLTLVFLFALAGCDGVVIIGNPDGEVRGDPTGDVSTGDPAGGDPVTGDPAGGEPGPGDPGAGDQGAGDPVTGDPGAGDPGAGDPGAGDPGAGDPGAGDPGAGDPGAGDPGNPPGDPPVTVLEHTWTRTNPGAGGAFSTMEAGPTGTIIAGSDLSGAYRSTNSGATWDVLGANVGVNRTHVSGVGFDPSNGDRIFLGTTRGVFLSNDGGDNFSHPLANGYVNDIAVAPSDATIVYAAYHSAWNTTEAAVHRSANSGVTWQARGGTQLDGLRLLNIQVDPTDPDRLMVISGKGRGACGPARLYRSTNGGADWTRLASGLGVILDVKMAPSDPSIVYLTTMNADCAAQWYYTDRLGEIHRSADGGDSWTHMSDRTGALFIDPSDATRLRRIDPRNTAVWNSESGTWTSDDSGATWSKTGPVADWDTAHLDEPWGTTFDGIIKGLQSDMSDADVILWIGTQWAFRSDDGGTDFDNVFTTEVTPGWWQSTGIDNVNMVDFAVSESEPTTLYAGYFDIGFWRSLDHGQSWQSGNNATFTGSWGDNGGNVASIVADPTRPGVVWSTMSLHQEGDSPTYLVRSDARGERSSWVQSNAGLADVEVMGLSLDRTSPTAARTLFVTAEGDVYRSTDDGANWSRVRGDGGLRFTAVDHVDGTLIYAGGGSGLWRSVDGGDNWTEVGLAEMRGTTEFWGWGNGRGVFDIVPDRHATGRVWVTVFGPGKGLYRSDNRGDDWSHLVTDDFMRKVDVSPLDPQIAYATSSNAMTSGGYNSNSHGVLYSRDAFASPPTMVNNGMAWPFAMTVDVTSLGTVFVGSPGTGFQWSLVPTE